MPTVWVIQHAACETPGTIAEVLRAKGVGLRFIRPFAGDPLPRRLEAADGLILMGGPMSVYEHAQYPFLREERRLIEHALREGKPVLGVCLGSQLLAATLGASVTRGLEPEIGWYPVSLTDAARLDPLWEGVDPTFMAFHWHGDVFELPKGAVSLARSERTLHQAFRFGGTAYGLLFHLEMTEAMIHEMVRTFAEDLRAAHLDGDAILEKAAEHVPHLRALGEMVFRRWAALLAGPPASSPEDLFRR